MSDIERTAVETDGGGANMRIGILLQRFIAAVFAVLGIYVATKALDLPYYTPVGPGPAFFPFWLGVALTIISAGVLGTSLIRPEATKFDEKVIPERPAALQMAAVFGMIAVFALTIQPLGFVISIFSVLLVLQLVNGARLPSALLVAIGSSLGVGYAFSNWLGVYVPPAPNAWLAAIGL